MLGQHFKFHIVNKSGATIEFSTDGANNTFTIKAILWKFDSDGAVVHSSEVTLFADPTADLADGNSLEAASAYDNSTNHYIGAECIAALLTDAPTSGSLDIYYEHSTDGGTVYPSDANDFNPEQDLIFVGSIQLGSTTEDRTINFSI